MYIIFGHLITDGATQSGHYAFSSLLKTRAENGELEC